MDPCPYVRLTVDSLALKLPSFTRRSPLSGGVHPSTTPCFCKIHINNFPSHTALLPLLTSDDSSLSNSSAAFHLDSAAIRRFSARPLTLRLSVYAGSIAATSCCGFSAGARLLGRLRITVPLSSPSRSATYHSGWLSLGKKNKKRKKEKKESSSEGGEAGLEEECSPRVHMVVRSEPDPRFVFQFGGEPECSPVVFLVQENNIRQPVFSCKFSADRNSRTRSTPSDFTKQRSRWERTFSSVRERQGRERKGWIIMIHDLSGSPVAAASMITPFVPSPGSDRVSRSNPGAWLILRPSHNGATPISSWKPWGRLEAWRERGPVDGLGYKFELVTESNGIPIAESTMSTKKGGEFCIDYRVMKDKGVLYVPHYGKGFVMGSSVEGEGKVSKPVVQIGAQHVTCMADAALFIALSAAIDLSMDACKLFSHKLRKELCHEQHNLSLS
ncbi:hypothetical protein HN51_008550 [Arachis hypogaea]|uniref:DUF1005 domain-containing protein n=1 Tax=Arachis hypogaea TaxID=3818 RepID=A0A445D2Y4_ARAHY|nr:uncharacterized protein LOC112802059 [Arachis hypogaea]QHO42873.1 uncharacterized protein DS421_5g157970 [Arachis hypogaea]RYR57603.1 hypothetical protein Ahy_A05g023304 [Arachis hypogaea]